MRVLVTGIEGFVGSHLTELLLRRCCTVAGIVQNMEQIDNIAALCSRLSLTQCDIRDRDLVAQAVLQTRPNAVIHLVGISSVAASFRDPQATFEVNLGGALNLLEAARLLPVAPRLLMVGSCEQYGPASASGPVTEEQALRPSSPYAVSKAAQEMLSRTYASSYGLPIVCVRPFHHIGPRQAPDFVCSSFARQIAQIEHAGGTGVMSVGNLDAERDFSDVRDVVRAYVDLLDDGAPGEVYNVCSERTVSIRWILDTLLSMSEATVRIDLDEKRMRPSDVPRFQGSAAKLKATTGWHARISLAETLGDVLNDWRERLSVSPDRQGE